MHTGRGDFIKQFGVDVEKMHPAQIGLCWILRDTRPMFDRDPVMCITGNAVTVDQIDRGDRIPGEVMIATTMYGDNSTDCDHVR